MSESELEIKWFWVGLGQPHINGQPVKNGEEIDPKDVHEATWKRWVDAGDVSNATVAVKVKDRDHKSEFELKEKLTKLRAEVKGLKASNKELEDASKSACPDCKDKDDKVAELIAEVADKDDKVAELEKSVETLTSDLEAATAPKDDA